MGSCIQCGVDIRGHDRCKPCSLEAQYGVPEDHIDDDDDAEAES